MTELIEHMTIEQTRAAAQELLDSTTGDLTGADAERFQALTRHADSLRQRQEQRDTAARDMVRRFAAGDSTLALEGEAGMRRTNGSPLPGYERPRAGDEDHPVINRERDAAMRVLDRSIKDGTMVARGAEAIERLLTTGAPQARSWAARWAAATGSEHYLRAFAKKVANPEMGHTLFTGSEAEAWRTAAQVQAERAMSLTDTAGGFLAPAQLDPAILLSSDGSANPLRQMARVVQTVSDVHHFVSSEGVDAHWYAEAAEVSDDSPALEQPAVPNYRGSAWVPFSIELEGDGIGFVSEIGRLLMDSVEQLTAAAYVNGSGTGQPTGFIPALTGVPTWAVNGAGSETVAAADPFALQSALPARFQANSAFAANLTTTNVLRQAETSAGALKFPSLQDKPPMLCGRPIFEVSHMASVNAAVTDTVYPLVLGDWSQMVISDRIGSTIELVQTVFGANRRPTGQRGFFAWFRTGSDVLVNNAFRVLKVTTTA
ncbi:phage major capsid protein [Mycobacterium paragordonae]|uniref:Major capsid protein n=1 Tax=Mycobacterium paragordonae TaxID=1389713 RepID=A0ABQ1CAZ5_9MYCO|nr:phage major capsid protein [Mycobacterium paragordonae]AYE97912.1 phage major capsid protein [Mycobacterium paragordonae]GFG81658.1 major capsid protein [Mycobacterium paragordonae]